MLWKKIDFLQYLLFRAFIFLTIILYYPFIKWFGQGYTLSGNFWKGDKTPIGSYLDPLGILHFYNLFLA